MGLLNNPNFNPNDNSRDAADLFVNDEKGNRFRVVDGDTVVALDENGVDGQSYRIGDLAAQERHRSKNGEFYQGEIRGDYDKRALYEVLNNEGFNLTDLGKQGEGQGGDRRNIAKLTTTEGEDVATKMYSSGIFDTSRFSNKTQIEAEKAGRLQRELFGEDDGYQELRADAPIANNGFKTRATTEGRWFNPDYHFGVEFDKKGVTRDGYTTNVLSTAWDTGVSSAVGDFGGFLEALGTVTPWYGEYLQESGKTIQGRQQVIAKDLPFQRVGTWNNLMEESDSAWDYLTNGIEYIGLNTVQSAPYLAGVAAGAVGATAVTALSGGAAAAAVAGAAATIPLAGLHAGNVWNQIDKFEYNEDGTLMTNEDGSYVNNRTKSAAAKALTAGVAMATLDRLGLHGAIGASDLLTVAGKDRAKALIRDKFLKETGRKLSAKEATVAFNRAAHQSTVDLVDHMGRKTVEERFLKKGLVNLLGSVGTTAAKGAASEGITEVSQELTAYLVANQVNEEIVSFDQLINHIQDNYSQGDDIRTLIVESAAGGVAVGGGINIASNIKGLADRERFIRKYIKDGDPKTRREVENIFVDNDATDGTISEQINRTNNKKLTEGYVDGVFYDFAEKGKDLPYWKQKLFNTARGTSGLTPLEAQDDSLFGGTSYAPQEVYGWEQLSVTPAAVLDIVTHYAGRAVESPLFNHFKPEVLRATQSGRSIVSRLSKSKGGGNAGRTVEQTIDWTSTNLTEMVGKEWFKNNFGMTNSGRSKDAMSNILRSYGKKLHSKVRKGGIASITDADIQELNNDLGTRVKRKITREDLPKLLEGAQRFELYQKEAHDVYLQSLTENYGIDSEVVQDYKKSYDPDWWWSHRLPDKSKVAKNPELFKKFLSALKQDALNNNKNLTDFDRKKLQSPDYVDKSFNSILRGRGTDDFSLVGGQKWGANPNKRLLDWGKKDVIIDGEKVSMDMFHMDDMFGTMEANTRNISQKASIMSFFGDGGSSLDVLFTDMRSELEASGMNPSEVQKVVQNTAKDTKNIIDSITGNYNRIENPRLERLQSSILQFTTIAGLLLAGLSSLPEYATVMLDLTGAAEYRKALGATLEHTFGDLFRNIYSGSAIKGAIDVAYLKEFNEDQRARIENKFDKVLTRTGLSTSQADLYKRVGVDQSGSNGLDILDIAHSAVFTFNALEAITNSQRMINASVAIDFIRNRAMKLAAVPEGETYSGDQFDAYRQLRELGIDVPTIIAETRMISSGADFDRISTLDDDAYYDNITKLDQQIEIGVKNFVDFRIQNPGAANRPLWSQDPHWRLLTQFNGFTSTVTTTLVPKLWNEKFMGAVKTKNPALTYDAFALITMMVALGGLSQWIKDLMKYGETSPYLDDDKLFYRAFLSSGVIGQYEKAAQVLYPLYEQRGEGVGNRIVETATGPIGRQIANVRDAAAYAGQGRNDQAINSFLKNVPIFSAFPEARNFVSGKE